MHHIRSLLDLSITSLNPSTLSKSSIELLESAKMCRAYPKRHPCGHTSISWYYCPFYDIDPSTGVQIACPTPEPPADVEDVQERCPLKHCPSGTQDPHWTCCQCNDAIVRTGAYCEELRWMESFVPRKGQVEDFFPCMHMRCPYCPRPGKDYPNDALS
jgi:hypothetical protein